MVARHALSDFPFLISDVFSLVSLDEKMCHVLCMYIYIWTGVHLISSYFDTTDV